MKIIKRDGSEVTFDITKIANAIKAASDESPESERLTPRQIDYAAHNVADSAKKLAIRFPLRKFRTWWKTKLWHFINSRLPVVISSIVMSRT